jgi:hypothetical protein
MRGGVAGAAGATLDRVPRALRGPVAEAIKDRVVGRLPAGECAKYAQFNEKPSVERMGMALVSLLVALVVIALLGLVALTVLGAQIVVAGHLVAVPFAVVVGTVPGTGRQLLVKWAGNVMQAYVVIVAMSFLLAMLLVGTTAILGLPDDHRPLGKRYLVLLLVVCLIFRMRKRLTAAVQYMTIRTAEKLQTRDAQGRTVGVAGGTTAVMGLEPTYAAVRARHPEATMRSEVDRASRKEVEALWE